MSKLRRNVAAGATTMLVAASAMLALPGSAAAVNPIVAKNCGQTLRADAGAPLSLNLASALGISGAPTIGLGTVTEGTRTYSLSQSELADALSGVPLLGTALPSVCNITVTGVKTATAPVQDAVKKATEPVTGALKDGAETVKKATDAVSDAIGGSSDPDGGPPKSGNDSDPQGRPGDGSGGDQRTETGPAVPPPTSPPVSRSASGFGAPYYSAFSPMSAFSTFPYRNASFSTHAPGLRYGSGFSDYAPSFGVLGGDGANRDSIANAGSADVLPPADGRVGLPVLLAVLALAAASAGLVRSWVLRGVVRG